MKAVPQIGIVLGAETVAEGHAFRASAGTPLPIGHVEIRLEGLGSLSLHSTSPEALLKVAAAFCTARWELLDLIAAKESAQVSTVPGADASDEANALLFAAGERLDDEVVTEPRGSVAAPPSDSTGGA